jgi:spermidine/putrescine-binding protein
MTPEAPFSEHRWHTDRRRFLALTGLALTAAGLTACGSDSNSSGSSAKVGGDLNLYVWEGYDTPADFKKWLKSENIKIHTKYITQPEEVPTVLKGPGGDKWDMSYGDNVVLDYYVQLKLLQPLSTKDVPGLTGLLPAFQKKPWINEDGTYNGIPWTWGYTGLTYRSDRVEAPKSWQDLLKPELKGKVSTIDGALNNVALACLAVGVDPDTLTKNQLNGEVAAYLRALMGQVRTLAPSIGDQISLLVSGDIDYMVAGLKFMDAETADKGVKTETIVPQGGAIGWADTTFITPSAPHLANALAYANHLLDPKVNAAANSELLQGPGVQASITLLTPEAKKQYPYDDLDHYMSDELTFNQGFPHEADGDRATYQEVLDLWQSVKTK